MVQIIDNTVYNFLLSLHSSSLTNLMLIITNLASAISFISIIVVTFIIFKGKKENKYILLNLILVFLFNLILKNIFVRERPTVLRLVTASGYSFPSAHSMISIAFYGFLIYLIGIKGKNNKKVIPMAALAILILLIGVSRIYLGVHYATDVIGAFIIGSIYLIIFIKYVWKKQILELKKK